LIVFDNVGKVYHTRTLINMVLRDVDFAIHPGDSLAILGANGAGKSTLMRLISGVEHPTSGRIAREMSVSWPIGYTSCFQSSLTGADNARFIARIYRQPVDELLAFVEEFAQLDKYFRQPVNTYSAGMSARLAFGISLAIDFDCYLVDEVTAAGDMRFRERCHTALMHRRDNGTLIMVSHDAATVKAYCRRGAVLRDGRLSFYDTVDEAWEAHHSFQLAA
jgi:capsular polysaccharide transport system ATP-binding protein